MTVCTADEINLAIASRLAIDTGYDLFVDDDVLEALLELVGPIDVADEIETRPRAAVARRRCRPPLESRARWHRKRRRTPPRRRHRAPSPEAMVRTVLARRHGVTRGTTKQERTSCCWCRYYSTSAHEHTHWTGHVSRLDRDLTGRFEDRHYGAEELIAELGAAFWCAQFGLEQATRNDHAAYLGDWLAILSADPRALLTACSHAQRAIDHLNDAANYAAGVGASFSS